MNLIQVQEQLKGLPTQALMAYANGKNPEVPPYVALAELSRRKQMEQSAQQAQPNQGTVKDRIEQEAGLMNLQKQRQQQAMQSISQRAQNSPQMNPDGAEGIAGLAGGAGMPQAQAFRKGGITAMAEGKLVTLNGKDYEIDPETGKVIYNGVPTDPSMLQYAEAHKSSGIGDLLSKLRWSNRFPEAVGQSPADTRMVDQNTAPGLERAPASWAAYGSEDPRMQQAAPAAQPIPPAADTAPEQLNRRKPPVPQRPVALASLPAAKAAAPSLQAPQMQGLQQMYDEQQGIINPLYASADKARQEKIALLKAQQAEREQSNPMAAMMAYLTGGAGSHTGHWQDESAASTRAVMATQAEQQRIKEEANREVADMNLSSAEQRAKEARESLKDIGVQRGKQYESDVHMYGYNKSAETQMATARMHTQAQLASAQRQLEAGDRQAAYQMITSGIHAATTELASVDKEAMEPRNTTGPLKDALDKRRADAQKALQDYQNFARSKLGMATLGSPGGNIPSQNPDRYKGFKKLAD